MEILGLIDIPTWLLIIVFILFTVYYFFLRKGEDVYKGTGIKGPNSRWFYLRSVFKKGMVETQRELFEKYGPVVGAHFGSMPAVLVSDPELIKQICIKEGTNAFINRQTEVVAPSAFRTAVTFLKDDHWKFVRGVITPGMSTGKMKDMVPLIQKCCDSLIAAVEKKSKTDPNIDIKKLMESYSLDAIASVAFGIEIDSQSDPNNAFNKHASAIMNQKLGMFLQLFAFLVPVATKFLNWLDFWPGQNAALKFFDDVTRKVIEERRQGSVVRKDMIHLLIQAQKSGVDDISDKDYKPSNFKEWKDRGLNDDELISQSMIFFLAGFETVSTSITMACYALATNPEVQDKLIAEIDERLDGAPPTYESVFGGLEYLDKFFSEVLRLYATAQMTSRQTGKDITINGYTFKKGFDIHIPIHYQHLNPEYWPEPEKFDPERFSEEEKSKRSPYIYMPFGIGPRICVAQRLAIIETRMVIVRILQKYRIVPTEKTQIPIELMKFGFTKPKGILYLAFKER